MPVTTRRPSLSAETIPGLSFTLAASQGIVPAGSSNLTGANRRSIMQIGFVGLGSMGHGIATNLLRNGHELIVFDVSPAACEELVQAGALG